MQRLNCEFDSAAGYFQLSIRLLDNSITLCIRTMYHRFIEMVSLTNLLFQHPFVFIQLEYLEGS